MAYWNYRKMLKCGSHILLTKLVSLDELELAKVLLLSFFWSKKILFFSCFIKKFGLYSHFHPGSLESSCKALFVSYKWFNSLLLLTFPIKKKKKKKWGWILKVSQTVVWCLLLIEADDGMLSICFHAINCSPSNFQIKINP